MGTQSTAAEGRFELEEKYRQWPPQEELVCARINERCNFGEEFKEPKPKIRPLGGPAFN